MAKAKKSSATKNLSAANTEINVPCVRPVIFGSSSIFAKDIEYLKVMALLSHLPKEVEVNEIANLIGCSNERWLEYGAQRIGEDWKEVKNRRDKDFLSQFQRLMQPKQMQWQEGAFEFLQELVTSNQPRAICYSGWQDPIEKFVESRLRLSKFFPKGNLGLKIPQGKSKPSPWAYQELARNFGVRPLSLLVIENSEDGVRAAKAAGAGYIIKVSTGIPACPDASPFDELVESFEQIPKLIAQKL